MKRKAVKDGVQPSALKKGSELAAEADLIRCNWATADKPLYMRYHDEEWGVPQHNDHTLFEFLTLEGAQAGLSWYTILARRENYRRLFVNFDPAVIAEWPETRIDELVQDASIIRNRGKISSALSNAQLFCSIQDTFGSFDTYVWSFTNGISVQPNYATMNDIPNTTDIAVNLSRDLRRRGFRFIGPTICYAFMQAVGMTNDHITKCFRHHELSSK